jgi:DNA polymerase-3 subunit gamma/tau
MFKDLQTSTQPRLHLELGLVKLGHVGRLKSIEEILGGTLPALPPVAAAPVSAVPPPVAPKIAPVPPAPPVAPATPAQSGDLRDRLIAELQTMKATFTVDALEQSSVEQLPSELIVTAPAAYRMALQGPELGQAAHRILGRPMKITIRAGEAAAAPAQKKTLNSANPQIDPEAERRALAHPDVQRFQELFPGSEIRAVRDLSDYGGES